MTLIEQAARVIDEAIRRPGIGAGTTLDIASVAAQRLADAGLLAPEGEREVMYEVWQDDCLEAETTDINDARHYAAVYGQDGPVQVVKAVTYRRPFLAPPAEGAR